MLTAKVSGVVDFYGSVSVMREDSNPTTINHLQADSPEGMEMGHVDLRENSDLRRKLSVECNISKDTDNSASIDHSRHERPNGQHNRQH
ncbi:hypothetical protein [Lactobacillus delbrueckii]|uniref:hypothetical protein n=1 Tax=Lactobacillus delbrueckii TaxID=1584 RepID=UPI001E46058A|nr:hypothetical protein [Lactobacillus delbrueckii]